MAGVDEILGWQSAEQAARGSANAVEGMASKSSREDQDMPGCLVVMCCEKVARQRNLDLEAVVQDGAGTGSAAEASEEDSEEDFEEDSEEDGHPFEAIGPDGGIQSAFGSRKPVYLGLLVCIEVSAVTRGVVDSFLGQGLFQLQASISTLSMNYVSATDPIPVLGMGELVRERDTVVGSDASLFARLVMPRPAGSTAPAERHEELEQSEGSEALARSDANSNSP